MTGASSPSLLRVIMFDSSLDALCLLPPQFGEGRRGLSPNPPEFIVRRHQSDSLRLPTRLFLDNAPWHRWSAKLSQTLASHLQSHGIATSFLLSELGYADQPEDSAEEGFVRPTLQMLPYRGERYGLNPADFDSATLVDLRLSPLRDASGRFAYSAEQIRRWESTPEDEPLSGGGWVSAFSLPPDIPGLEQTATKIHQLRRLAPQAAVLVSVTPEWLWRNLDTILAIPADALLIRAGQLCMDGIQFAELLGRLFESPTTPPIWLSPPRWGTEQHANVDDCIKLISLGVSAIAIDPWMCDVYEALDNVPEPSVYSGDPESQLNNAIGPILADFLLPKIERFAALMSTIAEGSSLGSFDRPIAERLRIQHLGH